MKAIRYYFMEREHFTQNQNSVRIITKKNVSCLCNWTAYTFKIKYLFSLLYVELWIKITFTLKNIIARQTSIDWIAS